MSPDLQEILQSNPERIDSEVRPIQFGWNDSCVNVYRIASLVGQLALNVYKFLNTLLGGKIS